MAIRGEFCKDATTGVEEKLRAKNARPGHVSRPKYRPADAQIRRDSMFLGLRISMTQRNKKVPITLAGQEKKS
jgi:hypothetical protein